MFVASNQDSNSIDRNKSAIELSALDNKNPAGLRKASTTIAYNLTVPNFHTHSNFGQADFGSSSNFPHPIGPIQEDHDQGIMMSLGKLSSNNLLAAAPSNNGSSQALADNPSPYSSFRKAARDVSFNFKNIKYNYFRQRLDFLVVDFWQGL